MQKQKVVDLITTKYPDLLFESGDTYIWSPADKVIYYKAGDTSKEGDWALLHESGHALLEHNRYFSDVELIKLEVAAWEKAKEIATLLEFEIGDDHIQDCLDSYRDWLHKRSLCPDCRLSSVQTDEHTYTCIFCGKKWHVSAERFCRPYRRSL